MPKGTVKWFNEKKGFGFLSQDGGADLFVHHSGIVGEGFKVLHEGDRVEFEVENSEKGPRAVSVKAIS
jgi:CspA family cold shock protein